MNNTIYTCDLMGGLGNQMFQIAHTYAQSLRYNTKCSFKKISNTQNQGNNVNLYINNVFRKLNFLDEITSDITIYESSFNFKNLEINKNNNVKFSGYYQSEKNFTDTITK